MKVLQTSRKTRRKMLKKDEERNMSHTQTKMKIIIAAKNKIK